MACWGCGKMFRDKWTSAYLGVAFSDCVPRSTYHSLCYGCMAKALELEPASPQELLKIYRHLKDKGFAYLEPLITEQLEELEVLRLDPTDRMFNPRSV